MQGEIILIKTQMSSRAETHTGMSLIVATPNLCHAAEELLP